MSRKKRGASDEFISSNYVGNTEDIAINIYGCTLEGVRKILKDQPLKYQRYSVLMFRGVIDPIENIDFSSYLSTENLYYEHLQKKSKGIFFNEMIPLTEEQKVLHLEQCLTKDGNVIEDDEDWKVAVKAFKNVFQNYKQGVLYFRDIENVPKETTCLLESFHSHISVNEEQGIPEMPGINKSMHYVGLTNSYTTLHIEDGALGSINVLKYGAPKAWYLIDHLSRAEVENHAMKHLQSSNSDESTCPQILQHKIYLVSSLLLDEWKVPHTFELQKAGDLFYIRRGTYHAVTNIDMNLAEAINYQCKEGNGAYEPLCCECDESKRTNISRDKTVLTTVTESRKTLHECPIDDCQSLFVTKKRMKEHVEKKHCSTEEYECSRCQKKYKSLRSLQRHERSHNLEFSSVQCDLCGLWVKRMDKHERDIHSGKKKCSKCRKLINAVRIKEHEKTCSINAQCQYCGKIVTSEKYLSLHIKYSHPFEKNSE